MKAGVMSVKGITRALCGEGNALHLDGINGKVLFVILC